MTPGPKEVGTTFYADDGSWSVAVRDALNAAYFPLHLPTMNFGWVRDISDPVHDLAVNKYFQGPPNFWDAPAKRLNHQVNNSRGSVRCLIAHYRLGAKGAGRRQGLRAFSAKTVY